MKGDAARGQDIGDSSFTYWPQPLLLEAAEFPLLLKIASSIWEFYKNYAIIYDFKYLKLCSLSSCNVTKQWIQWFLQNSQYLLYMTSVSLPRFMLKLIEIPVCWWRFALFLSSPWWRSKGNAWWWTSGLRLEVFGEVSDCRMNYGSASHRPNSCRCPVCWLFVSRTPKSCLLSIYISSPSIGQVLLLAFSATYTTDAVMDMADRRS